MGGAEGKFIGLISGIPAMDKAVNIVCSCM